MKGLIGLRGYGDVPAARAAEHARVPVDVRALTVVVFLRPLTAISLQVVHAK